MDSVTLARWKKAVVHLECATDGDDWRLRVGRTHDAHERLLKKEITHREFAEIALRGMRDVRYHGTAVFVVHNDRRYLATARHVLWDETNAKRRHEDDVRRVAGAMDSDWIEHMAAQTIFSMIFRVPSLSEVSSAPGKERQFLMNLGAGPYSNAPYTFSEPAVDLAIVSLDPRHDKFADELLACGYVPVGSSEIGDGLNEGDEGFTVGYPSAVALIGERSMHPAGKVIKATHLLSLLEIQERKDRQA